MVNARQGTTRTEFEEVLQAFEGVKRTRCIASYRGGFSREWKDAR